VNWQVVRPDVFFLDRCQKGMSQKQFRNFCGTDFVLDLEFWRNKVFPACKYAYGGVELCPTSQKEHWQFWCVFKSAKTESAARKFFEGRHVESCKGNADSNEEYCHKGGVTAFEHGTVPSQGKRTDLIELKDQIMSGEMTVDAICESNPNAFQQYGRTLERLETIALRKKYRNWETEAVWIFGPKGTGKTHMAMEGFDKKTHYQWCGKNDWWDGYKGQETIIINEFRGGMTFRDLMELTDKWSYDLPIRGKEAVPCLAKKVIVTSSMHPKDVYSNLAAQDKIDQLYDRFDIIELRGESKRRKKSYTIIDV